MLLPVLTLLGYPLMPAPKPPTTSLPGPERLVAEALIWGADDAQNGYAFLPVVIHQHPATIVINLNCTKCDLALSTAALERAGVTLTDSAATVLDTLTIGQDIQHHVPLTILSRSTWHVPGPSQLPPVVGIVGVHFLTTHYDLLYDYPHRRVRLYAFPAPSVDRRVVAWLPPGITASDCGILVPTPPGAATLTGMAVRLDGHPVTGVIEMMPYDDPANDGHDEKMSEEAFEALKLPAHSPRIRSIPGEHFLWHGRMVEDEVTDVHITIGSHTIWTGPVKIFPELDVQQVLPPKTPVMLLNLTTIKPLVLFMSVSSGRVCLATQ